MRFKSQITDGFQVFAVSGINTISFAITASTQARQGLLGFAIERADPTENERYFMPGFKVFPSIIPHPGKDTQVSTRDHPVQSFVWDDFTGKPDRQYEYFFHPLRGQPNNLDRTAAPIPIKVKTEKLYSGGEHDVFFNRGIASSQVYARIFDNKKPDDLPPDKKKKALRWLSRNLEDALFRFIETAQSGDSLLCCFYEFRYLPVAEALQRAVQKGVDVKIIIDAKVNEYTDKEGKFHDSFPRVENLKTIQDAGIDIERVILREANPSDIQHNKFIVLLKGPDMRPSEVWTGSTNISLGGITGQTNVGHWLRNGTVAQKFKAYWDLVAENPGSAKGDSMSLAKSKKASYRDQVQDLGKVPLSIEVIPKGVSPIFSPRSGLGVLDLYCNMVDSSQYVSCITLAFGINKRFKDLLVDNTPQSHVVFFLLETKDVPDKKQKDSFVALTASNNVYQAWGACIHNPVYQWVHETNARKLQINKHVSYIHSKFLLMDPLGNDPIVVTGSANFSAASTNDNDENMLVIRGNRRVADIYFTEFNRLFNHYYFRAVVQDQERADVPPDMNRLFLDETGVEWLKQYAPGKLRAKRVEIYSKMDGFTVL